MTATTSSSSSPAAGKVLRRTDSSSAAQQQQQQEDSCGVGCFSVPGRHSSQMQENEAKSGRHCNNFGAEGWKCPDPGCKTSNPSGLESCSNCHLPKSSAYQFTRGQSKILKQL